MPASRLHHSTIAMGTDALIGVSPSIQRVRDLVARAAMSDAPVLIVGEAGTGKELLARAIHVRSARKAGPFVAIDCSSMREQEVELFGVAMGSGAPSGAIHSAAGGTLFVDEIAALAVPLQFRLLLATEGGRARRVGALEDEPVDLRIVVAAHPGRVGRRADDATRSDVPRLRHDLYRQRNALVIDVPPLRERREDVIPLA
ncbi:MAG TPA: sigma 54-interacting transcriptional regulator, partial [Labilithrix sp.]|nr:sigma 54-interacting transcriptional regulator [Labilithrix sp.]